MRSLIIIVCMTFGLAACQPQSTVNSNADAGAVITNTVSGDCGIASNTLADEKALFAAETAYNVPADAYVKLGSQLSADKRAAARAALMKAYEYLKLARKAYAAADGCSLKEYSDLAQAFGNEAKRFTGN